MELVSIFKINRMRICKIFSFLLAVLLTLPVLTNGQVFPNLGGQRAGISAMPFLKNDLSSRSVGMGGASLALPGDGFSMGVNPAGGVYNQIPTVSLSSRNLPAGLFHSFMGATLPMKNKSAWMVSMNYLSSGKQNRRTEFQPFGDGTQYSSDAWKVGVGYSKALSKMFSFGVNVNFIREQLAEYYANAASVDMGFLYKTDWKDLSFAVGLQHFGVNSTASGSELPVTFNRSGDPSMDSYGAPTLFSMGVSMVPYRKNGDKVTISTQLNHPNDNAENIRFGAEFEKDSLFFIRSGFKINVPGEVFSFGCGIRSRIGAFPLIIEATSIPTSNLGWQFLLGLTVGFHKVGQ
jgi:hypothetical protein